MMSSFITLYSSMASSPLYTVYNVRIKHQRTRGQRVRTCRESLSSSSLSSSISSSNPASLAATEDETDVADNRSLPLLSSSKLLVKLFVSKLAEPRVCKPAAALEDAFVVGAAGAAVAAMETVQSIQSSEYSLMKLTDALDCELRIRHVVSFV